MAKRALRKGGGEYELGRDTYTFFVVILIMKRVARGNTFATFSVLAYLNNIFILSKYVCK